MKFRAATHQICRTPKNNDLLNAAVHTESLISLLLLHCACLWFRSAVWQLVSHSHVWHNGSHYSGAAGWPTSDCCLGERLHSSSARRSLTYITSFSCTVSPAESTSQICFRWRHSDTDQRSLVCSIHTRYIEYWSFEADIDLGVLVSRFYAIVTRIVTKTRTRQFNSQEINFSSLWWTHTHTVYSFSCDIFLLLQMKNTPITVNLQSTHTGRSLHLKHLKLEKNKFSQQQWKRRLTWWLICRCWRQIASQFGWKRCCFVVVCLIFATSFFPFCKKTQIQSQKCMNEWWNTSCLSKETASNAFLNAIQLPTWW